MHCFSVSGNLKRGTYPNMSERGTMMDRERRDRALESVIGIMGEPVWYEL